MQGVIFTPFGRLDFDPLSVPLPATSPERAGGGFDAALDDAVERTRDGSAAEPRRRDDPANDAAPPAPPAGPGIQDRTTATTDAVAPTPTTGAAAPTTGAASDLPAPSGGEDGTRQPLQRLSSDAAAPANAGGNSPAAAKLIVTFAPGAAAAGVPAPGTNAGVAGAGAAMAATAAGGAASAAVRTAHAVSGGAASRGVDLDTAHGFRSVGAAAGYRTTPSAQVLAMAEAARDSVFRQIALRSTPAGTEVRMLLDPPELGHLDVHMVLDKGGSMRLSIGAERPELLLMLDKHMGELKAALQGQGLALAQAEVHARDSRRSPRDARASGLALSGQGHADDGDDSNGLTLGARMLQRGGFISADALDFWV